MKLNEKIILALPVPERGHQIHYFSGAKVEGTHVPRGFGVRVTAGGVRSFIVRYRCGRQERLLTIGQFPDWSALLAVREAKTLRQRIDRGEDPLAERRAVESASADTLKAVCEEYLKREGGRLRTADQRRRMLERLVYPSLGSRQIGDIRRSEIVRLLDRIEDENGAVMADRTMAVVRKIMNWHATRSDDFKSPVVRGMQRVKAADQARNRILDDDELRAVWRASEAEGGPYGHLVRFLLLTACRRSEGAGMTWGELEGSDWLLPAARNKVKQDLVRPLSDAALAVLPERIAGCPFVFTTNGRNPIGGFTNFKREFDAACGVRDWSLHDCRRTARSLMSRAGVPSDHAERVLGHVLGGVRGTYDRHEYHEEKRRAYEALAAQIERIVNPPPANVSHLADRRQAAGA